MSASVLVRHLLLPVDLALWATYAVLYYALLGVCFVAAISLQVLRKLLHGYFHYAYVHVRKRRYGRRSYDVTPWLDATVAATCMVMGVAYVFV